MQHRGRGGSNAYPRAVAFDPCIDEAITAYVRFSVFNPFFAKDSRGNRHVAEHMHGDRLRFGLLLVGWLRRIDAFQEFALGLKTAIVIDQNYGVVKDLTQRLFVAVLIGLVPGFLNRDNLGFDGGVVLSPKLPPSGSIAKQSGMSAPLAGDC